MKKILVIFVIYICILNVNLNVFAYSNDYLKIDIPSNYESVESGMTTAFDRKDGVVIQINVSQNVNKKNTINYKDELKEDCIDTLTNIGYYNIRVENIEDITIDNIKSFKIKLISKIQNIDAYMENYFISTENYIYGIMIISNNNKYYSSDEYKKIINSIVFKDTELNNETLQNQKNEDEIFVYSTIKGLLIAIPIIIIILIKKEKNKRS